MTERTSMEPERAELVALADELADKLDQIPFGSPNTLLRRVESTLRRLAAQDQKPVAWCSGDELDNILDDRTATVLGVRDGFRNTPLYLSPPPAAGWDAAQVNADADYLDALESELIAKDFDMRLERRELSPSIVADHLREALSHQTAAAEINASAEARLREALEWIDAGAPETEPSDTFTQTVFRHGSDAYGDDHDVLSDIFNEGTIYGLWLAAEKARKALSAHPHASDCDKQECMGDASPCDPKDLQELLAKPSVLEPSDRTADVTEDQMARAWKSEQNRYEILIFGGNMPCQVTCDGSLAFTGADEDCETFIRTRCARALLDAFTVGRR